MSAPAVPPSRAVGHVGTADRQGQSVRAPTARSSARCCRMLPTDAACQKRPASQSAHPVQHLLGPDGLAMTRVAGAPMLQSAILRSGPSTSCADSSPRVTGSSRSTETQSARSGTATSASSWAVRARSRVVPIRTLALLSSASRHRAMPVGDILHHLGDAEDTARRILHPERRDGYDALLPGITEQSARLLSENQRTTRLQHPPQMTLHGVRVRGDEEVTDPQPAQQLGGSAAEPRDRPVDPQNAQVRRMDGDPDRAAAENPVEHGAVRLPLNHVLRGGTDQDPPVGRTRPDDATGPEPELHPAFVTPTGRQHSGRAVGPNALRSRLGDNVAVAGIDEHVEPTGRSPRGARIRAAPRPHSSRRRSSPGGPGQPTRRGSARRGRLGSR